MKTKNLQYIQADNYFNEKNKKKIRDDLNIENCVQLDINAIKVITLKGSLDDKLKAAKLYGFKTYQNNLSEWCLEDSNGIKGKIQ